MEKVRVALFLSPKSPTGTAVWASAKVAEAFTGASDKAVIIRKLASFSEGGLQTFMPDAVKRECGKTFGIHLRQYRLAGFFSRGYAEFIALDCFVKKTQRNDSRMTAIYEKIEAIREAETWEKIL
jgi:delta 1-pyrroline-5-carboxylate dehydrogenase